MKEADCSAATMDQAVQALAAFRKFSNVTWQ